MRGWRRCIIAVVGVHARRFLVGELLVGMGV